MQPTICKNCIHSTSYQRKVEPKPVNGVVHAILITRQYWKCSKTVHVIDYKSGDLEVINVNQNGVNK